PLREAKRRARDMAPGERLLRPARRPARPRELPPPGHEIFRREGEPGRAEADALLLPAPDPGRIRIGEVHAPAQARYGERGWAAGALRLRDHEERSRRDDQLPHRPAPRGHGHTRVREG